MSGLTNFFTCRALDKRFLRLTTEHEKEQKHRRKADDRVMELEKQMAIFRVEQTESVRKVEDLQDAKSRVSFFLG